MSWDSDSWEARQEGRTALYTGLGCFAIAAVMYAISLGTGFATGDWHWGEVWLEKPAELMCFFGLIAWFFGFVAVSIQGD